LAALVRKFNGSGLTVSKFYLQHGIEVAKFKKFIITKGDTGLRAVLCSSISDWNKALLANLKRLLKPLQR
jgi:hypothetical protein